MTASSATTKQYSKRSLSRIVALPQKHELSGHSKIYSRVISNSIHELKPRRGNFRACFLKLWQKRKRVLVEDLRTSFCSNKSFDSGWWLVYQEQLDYLNSNSPLRIKGKDPKPFFTDIAKSGTYSRLFRKIVKSSLASVELPPLLPGLTRSPLYIQKKGTMLRIVHSPSRDIPTILNHLSHLWDKTITSGVRVQKLQSLAEFEWYFFTSNPLGRCAASLGDSLSLALQIKIGEQLRKKFQHMDWEALSRSLPDYISWRTRGLDSGCHTDEAIITQTEFRGPTKSKLEFLTQRFSEHHFILLENFLDKQFCGEIALGLPKLSFETKYYRHVGVEQMSTSSLAKILSYHFNEPQFLEFVRNLSGIPRISSFEGRIYKFSSRSKGFRWHDDLNDTNRRLGVSVNLSLEAFEGGEFELRRTKSKKLLASYKNSVFGDAIIFRISKHLEHRVARLSGKKSRVAFAGWFTL